MANLPPWPAPSAASVVSASATGGVPVWQSAHTYGINQLVTYGNVTWICLKGHISGEAFPGEGESWAVLSGNGERERGEAIEALKLNAADLKPYVDQGGELLLPKGTNNTTVGGVFGPKTNRIILVRMQAQATGILHDLSGFIGPKKEGKGLLGLYDLGSAKAGFRTLLNQSAAAGFAPAAINQWEPFYDPVMAIARGQMFDAAISWNQEANIELGRGASGAGATGSLKLPPNFMPVAGGAEAKLACFIEGPEGFKLPAEIAEAGLLFTTIAVPQIVGRIV